RFWGWEMNLREALWRAGCFKMDLIGGFRYFQLEDTLTLTENVRVLPGALTVATGTLPGTQFVVQDQFHTLNKFYGGQFGLKSEWHLGSRWKLDSSAKFFFGAVEQKVDIFGQTTISNSPTGGNGTFTGGLLALNGTNIGSHHRTRLGIGSEVGANL